MKLRELATYLVIGCVCFVVGLYINESKVLEKEKTIQAKMDAVSLLTNEKHSLQTRLDSQAQSYTDLNNLLSSSKNDYEKIGKRFEACYTDLKECTDREGECTRDMSDLAKGCEAKNAQHTKEIQDLNNQIKGTLDSCNKTLLNALDSAKKESESLALTLTQKIRSLEAEVAALKSQKSPEKQQDNKPPAQDEEKLPVNDGLEEAANDDKADPDGDANKDANGKPLAAVDDPLATPNPAKNDGKSPEDKEAEADAAPIQVEEEPVDKDKKDPLVKPGVDIDDDTPFDADAPAKDNAADNDVDKDDDPLADDVDPAKDNADEPKLDGNADPALDNADDPDNADDDVVLEPKRNTKK